MSKKEKYCPDCCKKNKTWSKNDSPIECAFTSSDWHFMKNNWNCWALDPLREIAESDEYSSNCIWTDDIYHFSDVLEHPKYGMWMLILTWYKSRGTTNNILFVNTDTNKVYNPTYNDIKFFTDWYLHNYKNEIFLGDSNEEVLSTLWNQTILRYNLV